MKRITIFVVLVMAMVLCLALTGCGQNTDKQEPTNPTTVNDGDGKGEVTDTEPTKDTTSDSSSVDNFNPKQDADGLYVYDVQGHEIRTRTNIWNYIGEAKINGEPVQNYFSLSVLAEKLGYTEKESADGVYKHTYDSDNGYYIFGGFQYDSSSKISYISSGRIYSQDNGDVGALRVEPYDFDKMNYLYQSGHYINLDMIILCVYSMEYYADGNTGNCWEDIFGETVPRIAP